MPFVDRSTLTYPATNAFPFRKWLDSKDPTSSDYKNFQVFDVWVNSAGMSAWILVERTATAGTWIQMASTGTGILSITGDAGGAVSADGANNIDFLTGDNLTLTGTPASNLLTLTLDGTIADTFTTDSGNAIPALGVLNILGTGGTTTSGAGNTVTVTSGPTIPTTFTTDAGAATPSLNNLNVLGGTGIDTAAAADTVTVSADATVATTYACDAGSATPGANTLNVIGAGSTSTSGAADTITVTSTGGGLMWSTSAVVGPTAMSVDNGYVANVASPSVCGFTLPLTAALGSVIKILGLNTGGWSIAQNAGQSIRNVDSTTTVGVGGSVAGEEANATVTLRCIVANTTWAIESSTGNLILT